jgi:DNA-binding PadR family transcriptional regulator
MALAEAILVCLNEEDLSGYELAKRFDTSVGFFWKASHQQIYRELAVLKDKGWVAATTVEQEGKPNKHLFSIKREGRQHLRAWAIERSAPATHKDDFLLKLYAFDVIDLQVFAQELADRRLAHQARLALYEKILSKRYLSVKLTKAQTGRLLALRGGLSYERHWLAWCNESLSVVHEQLLAARHPKG